MLRDKPPLLLPRRAVKDASIGGYHIAAGSVVYANNFALAHGERLTLTLTPNTNPNPIPNPNQASDGG